MPRLNRHTAVLATLVATGLAGGCASYQPKPLPEPDLLVAPGIESAAQLPPISHPRLPAASIDLSKPLSELDLARIALVASPDLAAQRKQVGVAQAQVFAAGLLPDPQITLSLDHPSDPSLVDGLTGALGMELGALLSRGPAVAKGRHELERVRNDVAWNEWLVINQVRTLVRRLAWLESQVQVAQQAVTATEHLYELSKTALAQGNSKLDETAIFQVGYLDAQDRLLALRRTQATTRVQLNALVGLAPETVLSLAPPPPLQPLDKLIAAHPPTISLDQRFDLLALREGYAAQEADLHRAVRASLPLPLLEVNRARDTSAVWTRGLSLAFSIPLWNRGRGDIRVSEATRDQLAAEYTARVYQARADIASAKIDLAAIERQRVALSAELPSLAHAAEVLSTGARQGDVALATYETVRASLLDKQLALLMLEQAQSEGEVVLESAAGDPLWPTDARP